MSFNCEEPSVDPTRKWNAAVVATCRPRGTLRSVSGQWIGAAEHCEDPRAKSPRVMQQPCTEAGRSVRPIADISNRHVNVGSPLRA